MLMASTTNLISLKHGISLWCLQSSSISQVSQISSTGSTSYRRRFIVSASSFANDNRAFVIVAGGNAAGYAARTFVEHGMADGKLCIVSKEAYAPYERPALTKAYFFPTGRGFQVYMVLEMLIRLYNGLHTCVGSWGERQMPEWYKEEGIELLLEDPVTSLDIEKQTLRTDSGKLLKYGSLIIATGCTSSRFPDKIGGNLPGVHYIRDVADANSLIVSLYCAAGIVCRVDFSKKGSGHVSVGAGDTFREKKVFRLGLGEDKFRVASWTTKIPEFKHLFIADVMRDWKFLSL